MPITLKRFVPYDCGVGVGLASGAAVGVASTVGVGVGETSGVARGEIAAKPLASGTEPVPPAKSCQAPSIWSAAATGAAGRKANAVST
jgi:hypothetical protein